MLPTRDHDRVTTVSNKKMGLCLYIPIGNTLFLALLILCINAFRRIKLKSALTILIFISESAAKEFFSLDTKKFGG